MWTERENRICKRASPLVLGAVLYTGGRVGVGKGVVVAGGCGERVKGMEGLHAGDGTRNHSNGVRGH